VVLGIGLCLGYLTFKSATLWVDAGAKWQRLPAHADAGPLPQTFVVPGKAYDYGATTAPLDSAITQGGMLVRVTLGAVQGKVGLSLDKPDGSALVSTERVLTAADSGKTAYFRVSGHEGPIALLVRNYDAEGQVGEVTINAVAYAPEARLPAKDLSLVHQAGVNEAAVK
jgi:hypothetical protein